MKKQSSPVASPVEMQPELAEFVDPRLCEHFREIYASLLSADPATPRQVLAFGGALYGEGTTTISLGVSTCLAMDLGRSTVLIEGDLARPSLYEHLEFPPTPGLSDLLLGRASLQEALRSTVVEGLWVLPAGTQTANSIRQVQSKEFADLMGALRTKVDHVVLDLPPLNAGINAPAMAGTADAVVLVVRAGVTPRRVVERALARLAGVKVSGVVLDGYRTSLPRWLERLV